MTLTAFLRPGDWTLMQLMLLFLQSLMCIDLHINLLLPPNDQQGGVQLV